MVPKHLSGAFNVDAGRGEGGGRPGVGNGGKGWGVVWAISGRLGGW